MNVKASKYSSSVVSILLRNNLCQRDSNILISEKEKEKKKNSCLNPTNYFCLQRRINQLVAFADFFSLTKKIAFFI